MAGVDPVCGMTVEEADAVATVEHGGEMFLFCSADCAEEFQENPEDYV